jgi:hypothetical protein
MTKSHSVISFTLQAITAVMHLRWGAGEAGWQRLAADRWHGEACQPVAQGWSLAGLSIAQMRVIWSPAISNAITATVAPSC